MEVKNFTLDVKVILGLESTILDGLLAGRTGKLIIEPATAQLELGLGLSLAFKSKSNVRMEGNVETKSCCTVLANPNSQFGPKNDPLIRSKLRV